MLDISIITISAFLAGVLNSIAGGGSFLTFPALVFIGVPPIPANATSAVAVFPGYLSSTIGFLKEIKTVPRPQLVLLITLAIIGGVAGSLLLLVTPSETFKIVVPWLLLFATLLFAFDKALRRIIATDEISQPARVSATLVVTTYGGYFNGGLGIVLLALFSALGYRDMNVMNGLKNGLSFILSLASVVTFAIAGIVFWKFAFAMMVASTIGGYVGAKLARKLSVSIVRAIVITVGFGMSAAFFVL